MCLDGGISEVASHIPNFTPFNYFLKVLVCAAPEEFGCSCRMLGEGYTQIWLHIIVRNTISRRFVFL